MNRILAFAFFMLFLAAMAFVMLRDMQTPDSAPDTASASIIDGDWLPAARGGDDQTFVRFEADGKFGGFAGCNSFFGSYVATDTTLQTGNIGATRKMCPEPVMQQENQFLQQLQTAVEYSIKGNTMILVTADEQRMELQLREIRQ